MTSSMNFLSWDTARMQPGNSERSLRTAGQDRGLKFRVYLARFPEEERAAAFKRFTAVRENYVDMLVLLSRGPYSHVPAAAVGETENEWLDHSDTIRRFHELTHVICRRQCPGDVALIRDELVADVVGLVAAYGRFDPVLERRFLGIDDDGRYTGGRLGNYTDTPETLTGAVCAALERIRAMIENQAGTEPFRLIPALMKDADMGETKTQTRRNTP